MSGVLSPMTVDLTAVSKELDGVGCNAFVFSQVVLFIYLCSCTRLWCFQHGVWYWVHRYVFSVYHEFFDSSALVGPIIGGQVRL